MSTVTVESMTIPDCHLTGDIKLRIFLMESFFTSDGVGLQQSNPQLNRWYKTVDCDLSGTDLSIDEFTIDSTTDGIDKVTARYTAYFYRGNTNLGVFSGFEDGFKVPPTPTPTSWDEVREYNRQAAPFPFDVSGYYTKDQSDRRYVQAGGSGFAPSDAKYILQTADADLSNAQVLGSLATGLTKVTTTTGVLSTAIAGTDYESPLTFSSPLSRSVNTVSLANSGVLAGSYTNTNLTVDAFGRVTAASSGSAGGVTSLNSLTGGLTIATGTTGSDFNVAAASTTVTLHLPDAGASARGVMTTGTQTIAGAKTFTGAMTHIQTPAADSAQGSSTAFGMFGGAYGTAGTQISAETPATYLQNIKTGGTQGVASFGFLKNFQLTGTAAADTYPNYLVARYTHSMSGAPTLDYYHEVNRVYLRASPTNISGHSLHFYAYTTQAERTVANVRVVGYYCEPRNSAGTDASVSNTSIDTTFGMVFSPSGQTSPAHNTGAIFGEGSSNVTSFYYGQYWSANSLCQRVEDYTATTFTLQGTWSAAAASATVTGSGGHADVEVVAGDWIIINSVYCRVSSATANSITLTGIYSSFGGSGSPSGLTITKSVQATWLRVNQPISVLNTAGSARKELVRLDENDLWRFDYDGLGSRFGGEIAVYNSADATNKATIKSLLSGGVYYPGIWFGSATPSITNFGFLSDVSGGITILNASNSIDFRIGNAAAWEITVNKHFFPIATTNTLDLGGTSNTVRTAYLGTSLIIAGGTALTTTNQTGTGSIVMSTSPSLTTPALGTPSAGVLTNCTGYTTANLSGTVAATQGGTGQTSYAVGDLLYASTTTALSKLADVATGSILVSGGVSTAPAWSASPTITTSLTCPVHYGGSGTSSTLLLEGTSNGTRSNADVLINSDYTTSGDGSCRIRTTGGGTYSLVVANEAANLVRFVSTAASATTAGAGIQSANANTPSAAGHRLGFFTYGASNGIGGTQRNAVLLGGYAAASWTDGSDQGAYFTVETTPIGGVARAEMMRVSDVGNVKIGGTANRGTTEGTKHIDIFDGTAPVGTLTNGISLYSASGECRVMDAAGNSTLLSPHDKITNEWVYDSIDTRTGKRLRVDMEKLVRFVNNHFGTDFVHDFAV